MGKRRNQQRAAYVDELRRQLRDIREPHPNPGTEAEIQRIFAFQELLTRKMSRLTSNEALLYKLRVRMMWRSGAGQATMAAWERQRDNLQDEIARLDKDIFDLNVVIDERVNALSDNDKAFM